MALHSGQVTNHKTLEGMSATRSRAIINSCQCTGMECESHTCIGKEAFDGSMEGHTIDYKSKILAVIGFIFAAYRSKSKIVKL